MYGFWFEERQKPKNFTHKRDNRGLFNLIERDNIDIIVLNSKWGQEERIGIFTTTYFFGLFFVCKYVVKVWPVFWFS